VNYILEAVPEAVLSSRYRNIISGSVNEPVMASEEIKRNGPKGAKSNGTKSAVQTTSSSSCSVIGMFKYILYFLLLVGASSKFETTRPYYTKYAEPYYNAYMKVTFSKIYILKKKHQNFDSSKS